MMSLVGIVKKYISFAEKFLIGGVLLLMALLPLLYIPNRPLSYIESKSFFFMVMVDILVIIWVWLACFDARYRLSRKNIIALVPIGLFLVSLTVSSLLGPDRVTSFFSTIESGAGIFFLYHTLLFAGIIAVIVRVHKQKFLKNLFQAVLLGAVILAGATFFTGESINIIGSKMLLDSSGGAMAGNSLIAAAYLTFAIFFGLILVHYETSRKLKFFYGILTVFIVFCPIFFLDSNIWMGINSLSDLTHSPLLIIGQARIATAALGLGSLVSVLLYGVLGGPRKKLRIISTIGLSLVGVGLVVGGILIATPGSKINTFFVHNSENRIAFWHEAVQGIKERPLLGWGQENFHIVNQKYLETSVFDPGKGNEVWNFHPHNTTLEVLINGGFIALGLYVVVIVTFLGFLIDLYRRRKISTEVFVMLIGLIVAYLVQNQTMFDSVLSFVMFFMVIGIIAGLRDSEDLSHNEQESAKYFFWGKWFAMAVSAGMVVVFITIVLLPSCKIAHLQSFTSDPSDIRIKEYDSLVSGEGSSLVVNDFGFYALTFVFSYESQSGVFTHNAWYRKIAYQEVQELLNTIDTIWDRDPWDMRLALAGIRLENFEIFLDQEIPKSSTGQYILAGRLMAINKYADRAVILSPRDPQTYVALAETAMLTGDYKTMCAWLSRARNLNKYYVSEEVANNPKLMECK